MDYFARISSQNSPSNQLQKYLLDLVQKYNFVLLDDPEALFETIEGQARQACFTYRRCTAQKVMANREFKTREITSIGVNGLYTIHLHKVAGMLVKKAKPEPAPAPLVEPAEPETNQPRQAIHKSREGDEIIKFADWSLFSPETQALLAMGNIWRVYYHPSKSIVAEEYGGRTQDAF